MNRMNWIRNTLIMSTACGGVLAGCGADAADAPAPTASTQQALIGDALAGITAADFAAAKAAFNTVEGLDDGLGPIFNEKACGNCHTCLLYTSDAADE